MKYLIAFLILSCHGAVAAQDWYQGSWQYDASTTHRFNPHLTPANKQELKEGFDKWAGKITVNTKRVKGKRAKLGVPYRVVAKGSNAVVLEVKGGVVEIVKAFRPELRNKSLRCKVVRVSSNVIGFEVEELNTIRMYLRRVR